MRPVAATRTHVGPLPPISVPSPTTTPVYTATMPLTRTAHSSVRRDSPTTDEVRSRIAATTAPPTRRGTVANTKTAATTSLSASTQPSGTTLAGTKPSQAAIAPAASQAGSGSSVPLRTGHHAVNRAPIAAVAEIATIHVAVASSQSGPSKAAVTAVIATTTAVPTAA